MLIVLENKKEKVNLSIVSRWYIIYIFCCIMSSFVHLLAIVIDIMTLNADGILMVLLVLLCLLHS